MTQLADVRIVKILFQARAARLLSESPCLNIQGITVPRLGDKMAISCAGRECSQTSPARRRYNLIAPGGGGLCPQCE